MKAWLADIMDETGWIAPSRNPAERRGIIYPFHLGDFMAEIRIPVDMKPSEAARLVKFINALVVPDTSS